MADRFETTPTPIGALVVQRHRRGDDRGFLSRLYCADELTAIGLHSPIVQINQTVTHRSGTIRGMHFQRGAAAEDKFVSCLAGRVFDIAVDIRRDSPTFLQWHGIELSAENMRSFLIPKGFAHGFQTLDDDCELLYLHTAAYDPVAEAGVNPFDPAVAIDWPLPPTDISDRDQRRPLISTSPDWIGS